MNKLETQPKNRGGRKHRKPLRKNVIAVCCCAGVFVLILFVVLTIQNTKNTGMNPEEPADSTSVVSEDSSEPQSSPGDTDANSAQTESNTSGNNNKHENSTDGTAATNPSSDTALSENIASNFPYQIPGSNLVVENAASYDGLFIEDGSDESISGVTVLLLRNAGNTGIEYAEVSIERDGIPLQFIVSDLPAGGTVVVQEKNKTLYQEGNWTTCTAKVAEVPEFEMSEDRVRVEETGEQTLTITNLTDETIPSVRIFYKFYLADEDTYVGGITYTVQITNLEAGSSQSVSPSHYLKGSSKVMMIRTYNEIN